MNPNEYVKGCIRTEAPVDGPIERLADDSNTFADSIEVLFNNVIETGKDVDGYKRLVYYDKAPKTSVFESDIPEVRSNYNALDAEQARILHAAQGLVTETAEFVEALQASVVDGAEFDKVNAAEELGDLMWYIAIASDALGADLGDIMATNLKKLKERYPEKFTSEDAEVRDLDAERKILEA